MSKAQQAELTRDQSLSDKMVAQIHQLCLKDIAHARRQREIDWTQNFADKDNWERQFLRRRERLREVTGIVDVRLTNLPHFDEGFELIVPLGQEVAIARSGSVQAHAIRWRVLDGVTSEGVMLVPPTVKAGVVALPEVDWTPEQLAGIVAGAEGPAESLRRLAASGCLVVIPQLISRNDEFSGDPKRGMTNQPHREIIYRQAFQVGRHPIGYDIQKTFAAVDLLQRRLQAIGFESSEPGFNVKIGLLGVGDGGLVALHASALDTRIDSTLVSGYFQPREGVWQEPIDRNVWGLLTEFGDAELAGLIGDRRLVVEASRANTLESPRPVRPGRRNSAASGAIHSIDVTSVKTEWERAIKYRSAFAEREMSQLVVSGETGQGAAFSRDALNAFCIGLKLQIDWNTPLHDWERVRRSLQDDTAFNTHAKRREKRLYDELQAHVQGLIKTSHQVRAERWKTRAITPETWEAEQIAFKKTIRNELIGEFPHPFVPPNPRRRYVDSGLENPFMELEFDVVDGLVAGGLFALPDNLPVTFHYPTMVCQHGLEDTYHDVFSRDQEKFRVYQAFGREFLQRRCLVYAPQNPYRGGEQFRHLQRMLNPLKRTLFSIILAQHQQTVRVLTTIPGVDRSRIGFYGISYGGKTAMRVAPWVDEYALCVCSGDFTDWARTVASNDESCTYLFTSEYEIPEWNQAHIASYAELAMLIAPRPFLVEAGYQDGGQPPAFVASEFVRVQEFYQRLGIPSHAKLSFFNGAHRIDGVESYPFIKSHWDRLERRK